MERISKDEVPNDASPTASPDALATTTVSDHVVTDNKEDDEPIMDSPPQSSSPFEEGEKVLAYFEQLVYQAKIKGVRREGNGWRFFVHYHGWNNNWDEWVGIDRLMKNTEENRHQLQDGKKRQEMEKNAKTGSKPKTSNGAKGRKQKAGSAQKDKPITSSEKHGNFPIPPALKKQLIDDWECVAQSDKLVKLPRSPNVDEILSKYQDYRMKKETRLAGSVGEIVNGLRSYFDKALPAMLLYKNERQQYEEAVANNMAPSAVYGAEHLLRLFVKLPEMLHNAGIEENMLAQFQQNMVDFVKFLQKNQSSFFLGAQQSSEQVDSSEKQED